MISNTKTAHWALHIAVLQAVVGELYAGHIAGMAAGDVKALNDRIAAKSKAAATEMAAFLLKVPDPKAGVFGREILAEAEAVIAETLAEMSTAANG